MNGPEPRAPEPAPSAPPPDPQAVRARLGRLSLGLPAASAAPAGPAALP